MANTILHHAGLFLVYSSVCDAPIAGPFNRAGLEDWTLDQAKERALRELEPKIDRAIERGTSSREDNSLADTIFLNRAGRDETRLNEEQFIQAWFGDDEDAPLPIGRNLDDEGDDE